MPKATSSTTSPGKPSPTKSLITHAALIVYEVIGTMLLCVQVVYNNIPMQTKDWGPTLGKPRRKRESPDGGQWFPAENQVTLIKHFK